MNTVDRPEYDVVVIGGGIAGLSAAWRLRDRRILVLEAEDLTGGRIKTVRSGEYWVNVGAQMFPGDETRIGGIARELGVEALPIPGVLSGVVHRGRILAPPRVELLPLLLPLTLRERLAFVRAGLKLQSGVRGYHRTAKRRAGETAVEHRARILSFEGERTFAEYLGSLPGFVDGLFRNIARRTVAEPETLAAGAALALFSDVMGSKRAGETFTRAVNGGTAAIPEALTRNLGDRIVTSAEVTEVRTEADRAIITYRCAGREQSVQAQHAIVATPAPVTERILMPRDEGLSTALRSIRYGAFLSMAVFTDEVGEQDWDEIYAAVTPGLSFDFLFNHASPLRTGERRQGGAFMVFTGGPRAARMIETMSDEEIGQTYLQDLHALLPATAGRVVSTHVQRWPLGNIVATPGRAAVQPILERGVPGGRVHLAGDYFVQLGGMEPAVAVAQDAADRIRHALLNESLQPGTTIR